MPMVDDQMWSPPIPPPRGALDMDVRILADGEIRMAPEAEARMVEAIARRVAELLKAG